MVFVFQEYLLVFVGGGRGRGIWSWSVVWRQPATNGPVRVFVRQFFRGAIEGSGARIPSVVML